MQQKKNACTSVSQAMNIFWEQTSFEFFVNAYFLYDKYAWKSFGFWSLENETKEAKWKPLYDAIFGNNSIQKIQNYNGSITLVYMWLKIRINYGCDECQANV